jgi:hypothetical protein
LYFSSMTSRKVGVSSYICIISTFDLIGTEGAIP